MGIKVVASTTWDEIGVEIPNVILSVGWRCEQYKYETGDEKSPTVHRVITALCRAYLSDSAYASGKHAFERRLTYELTDAEVNQPPVSVMYARLKVQYPSAVDN